MASGDEDDPIIEEVSPQSAGAVVYQTIEAAGLLCSGCSIGCFISL